MHSVAEIERNNKGFGGCLGANWVQEMGKRTPKGAVAIASRDGWLQLRWRYQGKRYYLSLGLPDDAINRIAAQRRVDTIRLDMVSGNFDPTLVKYQGGSRPVAGQNLGAVALFEQFTEGKAKRLEVATLQKYAALTTWLREHFGDRPATDKDADRFIDWLLENLAPVTVQDRLSLLKAAWIWGLAQGLVTGNPWADLKVRKPPKQRPKAFTGDEVQAILKGFEGSRYYRHYYDFVRFRLNTGCRTGEAIALRWRHLNEDCTVIWIGEAMTKGVVKAPKTGKAREVRLGAKLAEMLQNRMTEDVEPDDLVFPAPRGGSLDEKNFAVRAWSKILEAAEIPYRKPYNTRHTFVSHCLERGMNPVEVAAITGHDVRTLYRDYAGLIKSHPQTPDLF